MTRTAVGEREHEFAARIAAEAGALLLAIRDFDRDADEVRAEGDRRLRELSAGLERRARRRGLRRGGCRPEALQPHQDR